MVCCKCVVTGRVQGVFYRASTQQKARQLRITGHAKNLPDGRVEVLACGSSEALTELKAWLWQGPSAAQVESVECTDERIAIPTDFVTH